MKTLTTQRNNGEEKNLRVLCVLSVFVVNDSTVPIIIQKDYSKEVLIINEYYYI